MQLLQLSPLVARTSRVFLFGALLIFAVSSLVMLAVQFWYVETAWRLGIDEVVVQVETPLAQALWNYDTLQLQSNLQMLVQVEGLYRAEIYDEKGYLLVHAEMAGVLPAGTEIINAAIDSPRSLQPIGTLRLYISDAPLLQRFWRMVYLIPVVVFFVEISMAAALLFFLLHRNVISRLVKVARAVGSLDVDKGFQSIELDRHKGLRDEIDEVAHAINKFQREILDERGARNQLELQSRNLSSELARMGRVATVQSLTTAIAHELNQPLGAILSNIEAVQLAMLDRLSAADPMHEVLDDIAHEARRAADIIRNLRNMTQRREAGHVAVSLDTIVREVFELARLDTRLRSIKLELDLVGADVRVMGVAVQLQQVVLNLITNACDAIEHAGISDGRIVLRTELIDARSVRLTVADNGPGIEAASLSAIAQPFFTTKEGGTGMGLWIAQMIVEQHGGKLTAGNRPGGGAFFTFILPVVQA